MALLSKEEEFSLVRVETYKKITFILTYRRELERVCPAIKDDLIRLALISDVKEIHETGIQKVIMRVFKLIKAACREMPIYEEIGICEDYFTLDGMEDICMLDERNIAYRRNLNNIVGAAGMNNFQIDGRNYSFEKENRIYHFRRLLTISEIKGIRLLSLYSKVTKGDYIPCCHQFNSGFYKFYPDGDLITGNIVTALKGLFIAHTWIETQGRAISPNLNFSQDVEEYHRITSAKDIVRIPFRKVEEDYLIMMREDPNSEYYEYLRNPDEVMARYK